MIIRYFVLQFLTLSIAVAWTGKGPEAGQWSKESVSLTPSIQSPEFRVAAPNKKTAVIISNGVTVSVVMNGKKYTTDEDIGISTLAELNWAPDSTAFFITWSEGGFVGKWITYVFVIKSKKLQLLDVTRRVMQDFRNQYECSPPEEPNIGGIRWMRGSSAIFLMAEVPPHSSCPKMGMHTGYTVSVPDGQILGRYSEKSFRAMWGKYLGTRFIGQPR